MPLTAKGKKIRKQMMKTYKTDKKTDQVFYAMKNEGKLKGVDKSKRSRSKKKK